jgi:hypothetical protein
MERFCPATPPATVRPTSLAAHRRFDNLQRRSPRNQPFRLVEDTRPRNTPLALPPYSGSYMRQFT